MGLAFLLVINHYPPSLPLSQRSQVEPCFFLFFFGDAGLLPLGGFPLPRKTKTAASKSVHEPGGRAALERSRRGSLEAKVQAMRAEGGEVLDEVRLGSWVGAAQIWRWWSKIGQPQNGASPCKWNGLKPAG